jgi:L-ascorbate metabolism protein UlaG (beta-lactamase superfamily)
MEVEYAVKITWLGQACFELATANGTVIICDPYDPSTGFATNPRRADIVTVSHEHFDHNYTGWIVGMPVVVRGVGERTVKGLRITGLPSYHDKEGGARRGRNTVFLIEADGMRICHLGDLGHTPSPELYAKIGKPDVLLIPVGGFYTIGPAEAVDIAKRIGARLTIPMHFNCTGAKDTPLATVDSFASAMGAENAGRSYTSIIPGYSGPRVLVLEHLR